MKVNWFFSWPLRKMFDVRCILFLAILMFSASESAKKMPKDWYDSTLIYQIYTRSFKDSNGDGMGDLKGIHEKLDYMKSVGYETLWIQSFFKSPMVDFGFDISDYKQIEPMFGTMNDLRKLIDAIHNKGMNVMIDFIPNHTSNESEWFIKSVNREEPYTDFYVWKDPKGYDQGKPLPPNNWLSVFGGSAWQWNEKRCQFYYRAFSEAQPDLNYRNPNVRAAMEDVLRFWLDFGVDGFRADAIHCLLEDKLLRDNPWVSPELVNSTNPNSQIGIHQFYEDENYEVTHEWRLVLDEYKDKDNKTRIIGVEAFDGIDRFMKYFGNETYKGIHFPFYFALEWITFRSNATYVNKAIHTLMDNMVPNGVPSWVVSSHDTPRVAARTDPEFSEAMFMIQLLLPGIANVYYGEEICMKNLLVRPDQMRDKTLEKFTTSPRNPVTRDPFRAPMQWDDTTNAGFTTKKEAWLPVTPEYYRNNVKQQLEDPNSHLNRVKRLIKLRKSPVIEDGELETCVVSEWMFMLLRKLDDKRQIVVIVNLGSEIEMMCINNCTNSLPETMEVHTSSANSGYKIRDKVTISGAHGSLCSSLRPKAGVVLITVGDSPGNGATTSALSYTISMLFLLIVAFIQ